MADGVHGRNNDIGSSDLNFDNGNVGLPGTPFAIVDLDVVVQQRPTLGKRRKTDTSLFAKEVAFSARKSNLPSPEKAQIMVTR